MHDEQIIYLIANKNQTGLAELEKKYRAFAVKTALRLLTLKEDAETCVNDAFYNIWQLNDIQHTKSLKGAVAACVRRRAVDLIRYETAEKRSYNINLVLSELENVCNSTTIEKEFDNNELKRCIVKFVEALELPDKNIFLMRYFYGMDICEITKKTHMSRNAIDGRLFKIRKKLKQALGVLG